MINEHNRHKWYSLLLLGLALLLASSIMACAEPMPSSPPTITAGPSSFNFDAHQGEANPASQMLSVWNSGGGTLSWSVSADTDWLILIPTSGSSTGAIDNIALSADMRGMDAGNYTAIVTISASGAANTPQTVVVNLTISPPVEEEEKVLDALDTDGLLNIGYNYPERIVTVEGVIVIVYYAKESKGQPTFLDFNDPYEEYFKCIIWEEDRQTGELIRDRFLAAFPPDPETYFLNKKVRVEGRIEIYEGAPEIILHDPSQIWVVE